MTNEELGVLFSRAVDLYGYDKIIGSKILEFRFEPIPNRKTMQFLHIKTLFLLVKILFLNSFDFSDFQMTL